ncbi:Type I restriction modification DNA specificity domain [uncultured Blautia sp.]|nr:restriction endonuclease subunit S [uncultured Blautia sp.]SCH44679.1 Type I restriction modification DNA specificity domain [uncultured Blautia sp.]
MEVMMKELGEIITGNTPSKKTEAFWSSEDICFIKPDIIADDGINEIVDSNEYISENARKKARVVGKNSIFITCIGSIGKIGIASDGEYAFNQQINAIIPNDRVQPKYLAYNLLFNKPRLVAVANAPVVPIINKSQFGEFTVNIETDIDRQCEIVDVLDKLTQIIQQRNKEISALDDLIKARFVELFGDLKTNSKGWQIVGFKDCADIDTNMVHDFEGYEDYPHIGIDSIEKETGRLIGYRTIAEDGIISGKYLFTPEHIIYSKIRPNLNKVAMPDFDGLCSADAYPILVKEGICNREYFGYTLRSQYFLDYILAFSNRTNLPKVNKSQVEGFVLPLPPIEVQEQFAAFVAQTDKSKFINQLL